MKQTKESLRFINFFLINFLFLILSIHVKSQSNEFTINHFTTKDGLSQSFVLSILQDSKGFMWLGTQGGLNRYDGYQFISYKSNPTDTTTISGNVIRGLVEDKYGNIWIATNHYGVNVFNRKTEKFTRFLHNPYDARSISNNNITCLVKDSLGSIWVGTQKGLNKFDHKTKQFIRYTSSDLVYHISNDSISALCVDTSGKVWASATGNTINCINPENNKIDFFAITTKKKEWNIVGYLCNTPDNSICVSHGNTTDNYGSVINSTSTNRGFLIPIEDYFNKVNVVFHYLKCSKKITWLRVLPLFGKYSGLYYFNNTTLPLKPEPIINENILCFYEDAQNIIWVGTENGFFRVEKNKSTIHNYSKKNSKLSDNFIRSICEINNDIWIGTSRGLSILTKENKWEVYLQDTKNIPDETINTIFIDSIDSQILLGTKKGISAYNKKNKKFQPVYNILNPPTVKPEAVWSFQRDNDSNLWVGTKVDGIYVFNKKKKLVYHFYYDSSVTSISNNNIWHMQTDAQGNLWIGTSYGLNRWMPESKTFKKYFHNPNDPYSICGNDIWWIHIDDQKRMWVTAVEGGISLYNPTTDNFSSITVKEGLPTSAIYGNISDKEGKIWISTSIGILTYNPATKKFSRFFGENDGLQGNEFTRKAMFKSSSGKLFFGGINGVSCFYPDDIYTNEYIPPIAITSFRIFDKLIDNEVANGDTITVNYDQNFLSFEFSALSYKNTQQNQYAYYLENFNQTWIYSRHQNHASYTNLDPGSYILRIKGSNNDEVWNEEGISITLIILPPWWMTAWFRIAFSVFIIAIITTSIYAWIQAIHKRHAMEQRVLNTQLQALRSQMNPHFIFNSLNSIQYLILNNDEFEASEYLSKFAKLVRKILENSRVSSILLSSELEYLSLYLQLEMFRFQHSITYEIKTSPKVLQEEYHIPSMIIQPYVENAIRHGLRHKHGAGHLEISLDIEGSFIHCIIRDNGVGRAKAAEIKQHNQNIHTSIAMETTQERLNILNTDKKNRISVIITDLYDNNGIASGTKVDLYIPILNN